MVLDCLFVSANPNICVNHFCGEGSLIQQPNQKGYSNDPQKYKGMIEKVNISQALNSLSVKDDADFFYGETSSEPVKIKKSDLNLQMNKANIVKDGDLNNLVEAGEYSVWNNVANIPTNSFYWVKVIGSADFVQIAISFIDLKEYKRSRVNGVWTQWK